MTGADRLIQLFYLVGSQVGIAPSTSWEACKPLSDLLDFMHKLYARRISAPPPEEMVVLDWLELEPVRPETLIEELPEPGIFIVLPKNTPSVGEQATAVRDFIRADDDLAWEVNVHLAKVTFTK